jgi:hypothetical protein
MEPSLKGFLEDSTRAKGYRLLLTLNHVYPLSKRIFNSQVNLKLLIIESKHAFYACSKSPE